MERVLSRRLKALAAKLDAVLTELGYSAEKAVYRGKAEEHYLRTPAQKLNTALWFVGFAESARKNVERYPDYNHRMADTWGYLRFAQGLMVGSGKFSPIDIYELNNPDPEWLNWKI